MAPLVVENAGKRFRQGDRVVNALSGVSLQIEQGSFVAIMGASGSGKSTLLHLMAGLTRPDEGRILINNTDLNSMGDRQLTLFRRRNIGLIFQAFNLIPTLTAAENMSLPLMLDGQNGKASDDKIDALLKQMGLTDRSQHRPDALSGGEQQRVAIGRALITNPAVILADEPTGNLDSVNSQAVCDLLRALSLDEKRTIVMVTHEPSVAAYAHEVVVLKDGRFVNRFINDSADGEAIAAKYQEALR